MFVKYPSLRIDQKIDEDEIHNGDFVDVKITKYPSKNGDVINCFGFKLILAKDTIFVNSPFSRALLINNLIKKDVVVRDEITDEEIINEDLYGDNDYFLRSPRMRKKLEPLEMRIDSPPAKENMQETPLIMTLAPMITMAASSLVTLISTIQAVTEGQRTWKQAIPALVITGTMIISGGEIRGTGSKQAVYNDGGTLTITGNPLLTNTSSSRAAVHNLNHGTLNILGGTIISNNHAGVNNDGGTLTIGTNDGTINTTVPSIQGKTYGITSTVNYTLYDGIIRSISNAVNNQSRITTIADNSTITTGTETIDGKTYKILYLQPNGQ